jgi:hypothetical protein
MDLGVDHWPGAALCTRQVPIHVVLRRVVCGAGPDARMPAGCAPSPQAGQGVVSDPQAAAPARRVAPHDDARPSRQMLAVDLCAPSPSSTIGSGVAL